MRLHRFYVKIPITLERFDISDRDLIHQWRTVFRYNVGSQVILFDGGGTDHLCMITSLRNLGATVEVIEKKNPPAGGPKINLWLCVGIIKKDNFELAVEKATELGVSHIIPVLCERSEKKNINMERLEKIAIESSEQSGRGDIPVIHAILELPELLESGILPKNKILLNLEGDYIGDVLKNDPPVGGRKDLAVFIGPEWGWSERELQKFTEHKIQNVSLGSQILRAETASIAIASLLLL